MGGQTKKRGQETGSVAMSRRDARNGLNVDLDVEGSEALRSAVPSGTEYIFAHIVQWFPP